jgi:uridylate kinase
MKSKPAYKRILLKISGEALGNPETHDIHGQALSFIANSIKDIHSLGVEIGVVVGGGNIFRGAEGVQQDIDRVTGDHMGMLATIINALAIKDKLTKLKIQTRVQSAVMVTPFAEPFILGKALRHLEKRRIVIFAGGTGNPFFSTDTAAALRANEIGANVVIKATKVDGIYDRDPKKYADAIRFGRISHQHALNCQLKVMDSNAFSLCLDNKMPIIVFDMMKPGNLLKVVMGNKVGTLVATP